MSLLNFFRDSLFEIQIQTITRHMEQTQLLSEEEAIDALLLRTDLGKGWTADISTNQNDSFTVHLEYADARSNKTRYLCRKMVCEHHEMP